MDSALILMMIFCEHEFWSERYVFLFLVFYNHFLFPAALRRREEEFAVVSIYQN